MEVLRCTQCGANLTIGELTSGNQLMSCRVCGAVMVNPRFGEFACRNRHRAEPRVERGKPRYEQTGVKRTAWFYLACVFIMATVISVVLFAMEGLLLDDVVPGEPLHLLILTTANLFATVACIAMPLYRPVYTLVKED